MAAAQNQPARRDHAVNALLAREPRIFFDAIDGNFGSAAEHREHGAVFEKVDGIVAPLAIGDHAPVQIQNAIEFEAIERHPAWQSTRSGIASRCAILAWIGFLRHRTHAASPVITGMILFRKPDSTLRDHALGDMIAPTGRRCKRPRGNRTEIRAANCLGAGGRGKRAVTGSLAKIIIPPNFRPATALLDCEKTILRWPGPFGSGFLSPQPPGVVRIGPVRRNYPHTGPTRVGPFLFGV